MVRSGALMLSVMFLAACGGSAATPPATDAATSDVTAADAPTSDAPIALDRGRPSDDVTAADVVTPDVVDASAPDVVTPDVVDASAPDVVTPDVVDASIPADAPRRSFGEIYETILRPRCAECHGADRTGSAFIMRDAMGAYRALVNVPVMSRWIELCDYTERFTGRVSYRVRPGDPAASLLYFLPECYVRDALHMRLTPEEREVIRGWILRGAPETEL